MTICIGLLCSDGAVVASDTQIGAGDFKGGSTKIAAATSVDPSGKILKAVAFAGAGHFGNVEAIRPHICGAVTEALGEDHESGARVFNAITNVLVPFNHIHNPAYGRDGCSRDFDILVATWTAGAGMLWATDGTAVRPSVDFDAIGIGGSYANEYLTALYHRGPIESGVLLASYVMMRTTNIVRDCGKEIQIVTIKDGAGGYLPRPLVQEIECMWEHNADLQKEQFHYAIGFHGNMDAVTTRLDFVASEFTRLRQSIKETISSRYPACSYFKYTPLKQ